VAYLKLTDVDFDRILTLRQGHEIMRRFVDQYNERGECSTAALLADITPAC
jgi:hypothetical protein